MARAGMPLRNTVPQASAERRVLRISGGGDLFEIARLATGNRGAATLATRPAGSETERPRHIRWAKPRANSSVRIIESGWEFEGSGRALSGFSVNHAQVENSESDQREDSAGESSGRCSSGAVCARTAIWRSATSCSAGDSTKPAEGILPTRKTRNGRRPASLSRRPKPLSDIAPDLRRWPSNSTVIDSRLGSECEALVGSDGARPDAGCTMRRSAADVRCRGAGLTPLRGAVDAGPETVGRRVTGASVSRAARRPVPVLATGCRSICAAMFAVSRAAANGQSARFRRGVDRASGAGKLVNPYALRCGAAHETDGRSAVRIRPEGASRSSLATPWSGPADGCGRRACECARKAIAVARWTQRFGNVSAAVTLSVRAVKSCDGDTDRRDIAGMFAGASWTAANDGAATRVGRGQCIRSLEVCEVSGPGPATSSAVRSIHSRPRGISKNLHGRNPRGRPQCGSADCKSIRTTKQIGISGPRAEGYCAAGVLRVHVEEFLNFAQGVSRDGVSCATFALFSNIRTPERVAVSGPNGKSRCAAGASSHLPSIIRAKAEFCDFLPPELRPLKHIRRAELYVTSSPVFESRCAAVAFWRFCVRLVFAPLKSRVIFARFDLGEKHIRRGEVFDTSCPFARCCGFSGLRRVFDQGDRNFFIFCEFCGTLPPGVAASKYIRKTELFDTSCSGAAREFSGKSVSEDFAEGFLAVNSGECLTGINIQKSPDFSKVISQADSSESITGINAATSPDLAIPHFPESGRGLSTQASFVSCLFIPLTSSSEAVSSSLRRVLRANPSSGFIRQRFSLSASLCRSRNVRNVARAAVRVIQVPQPLAIPGSIP